MEQNEDSKTQHIFYSKLFPTWCWILTVSDEDQPLLQEILAGMLDNDLSLKYWHNGQYFKYFSLLEENQGTLAGVREYGYWVLTKYLGIKTYGEYLDKFSTIICKSNFLTLQGTL